MNTFLYMLKAKTETLNEKKKKCPEARKPCQVALKA